VLETAIDQTSDVKTCATRPMEQMHHGVPVNWTHFLEMAQQLLTWWWSDHKGGTARRHLEV